MRSIVAPCRPCERPGPARASLSCSTVVAVPVLGVVLRPRSTFDELAAAPRISLGFVAVLGSGVIALLLGLLANQIDHGGNVGELASLLLPVLFLVYWGASALIVDAGNAILPDGRAECEILVTSENGNGVILGDSFLRSAYVVYDLENNEIAIAQAVLDAISTSNILTIPSGTGLPGVSSTATLILPANSATATAPPAGATTAVATETTLPSPTFNLGSAATAPAASTSSSSSSGVSATFVPGPWAMGLLLGSTPLLAACIL